MEILQGKEYFDLMVAMSKPLFINGDVMGVDWERFEKYLMKCSQVKLDISSFLKVANKLGSKMDGVKVVPLCSILHAEIAKEFDIPVTKNVAAAVIPNNLGLDLMFVDIQEFHSFNFMAKPILEHELVHIFQMRRGDLEWVEGGNVRWNGFNPKTLNMEEANCNFFLNLSQKEIISKEILEKPWECEAYALTTPVIKWHELFTEEAVEHMLSNLSKFKKVA